MPDQPTEAHPDVAHARPANRERRPFEYALIRVVPRVERGECFNAGVIVHSRPHRFLAARVHLDRDVLRALARDTDPDAVQAHLDAAREIAAGDPAAGPIARLSAPERFHWLVAPHSTIVQTSEVHTGLTDDPDRELEHLFRWLVLERGSPD